MKEVSRMGHGKVHAWKMTEEERLAYIAEYPIKPTEKPKGAKFSTSTIDFTSLNERKKAAREKRVAKK
jgi:hypothetical protein